MCMCMEVCMYVHKCLALLYICIFVRDCLALLYICMACMPSCCAFICICNLYGDHAYHTHTQAIIHTHTQALCLSFSRSLCPCLCVSISTSRARAFAISFSRPLSVGHTNTWMYFVHEHFDALCTHKHTGLSDLLHSLLAPSLVRLHVRVRVLVRVRVWVRVRVRVRSGV